MLYVCKLQKIKRAPNFPCSRYVNTLLELGCGGRVSAWLQLLARVMVSKNNKDNETTKVGGGGGKLYDCWGRGGGSSRVGVQKLQIQASSPPPKININFLLNLDTICQNWEKFFGFIRKYILDNYQILKYTFFTIYLNLREKNYIYLYKK